MSRKKAEAERFMDERGHAGGWRDRRRCRQRCRRLEGMETDDLL